MAPIGERDDREPNSGLQHEEDDGENIWYEVLNEVQSSSSSKLPSTKSLIVLGDNESGKTTLIARLQGQEDPRKGSGLEYMYIDIKDEYRDDQTRLGVWILDGDFQHRNLLKFALTENNFEDCLVILATSMASPWNIMDTLQQWEKVLSLHIARLKLSADKRHQYEENMVRHFQEYAEPGELMSQSMTASMRRVNPSNEEKVLLPLGETTLTNNLGIPIVVVLTKSDAISSLEKEHDYKEEHFDFIQQHVRKFCLSYGAALCYTSVKEDKNCDRLYKYLAHRIYGFPLTENAYVVEKDSVFIPAGWDNEKKISILYESMSGMKPEDTFEDVIVKPVLRKVIQRDADVIAEDEQLFLMKLQTQLNKQPVAGQKESPLRPPSGVQKPTTPRPPSAQASPGAAMAAASPKGKMDPGKPGAPTSEGVLANFFNSLLSKTPRAAAPMAKGGSVERTAMSRDAAAAELDKLNRAKNSPAAVNNQTAPNNTS